MCVVGKSDMYSVTTNAVHTYRRYPIGLATPTSRPALAMSDKSALSPLHPGETPSRHTPSPDLSGQLQLSR